MVRFLIPALIVFNLVLFGRGMGWLPGLIGDIPDPGRISRQVNPEQVKMLPAPPAAPLGRVPARP